MELETAFSFLINIMHKIKFLTSAASSVHPWSQGSNCRDLREVGLCHHCRSCSWCVAVVPGATSSAINAYPKHQLSRNIRDYIDLLFLTLRRKWRERRDGRDAVEPKHSCCIPVLSIPCELALFVLIWSDFSCCTIGFIGR